MIFIIFEGDTIDEFVQRRVPCENTVSVTRDFVICIKYICTLEVSSEMNDKYFSTAERHCVPLILAFV